MVAQNLITAVLCISVATERDHGSSGLCYGLATQSAKAAVCQFFALRQNEPVSCKQQILLPRGAPYGTCDFQATYSSVLKFSQLTRHGTGLRQMTGQAETREQTSGYFSNVRRKVHPGFEKGMP